MLRPEKMEIAACSEARGGQALDHFVIRGRRLNLGELFACDISSLDVVSEHRALFANSKPFEHVVVDGLFNADLLDLIEEEFPQQDASCWRNVNGKHETIFRSK